MNQYHQPSFYHFSEDSIRLAEFISELSKGKEFQSLIDLGAGCGVLGIETALRIESIVDISFIELQREYKQFLELNCKQLPKHIKAQSYFMKFSEFMVEDSFDIVIANPPYFSKGQGRASDNTHKQRCRTFEMDGLQILLRLIVRLRSINGVAAVVARNDFSDQLSLFKEYNFNQVKKFGSYSIFKLA